MLNTSLPTERADHSHIEMQNSLKSLHNTSQPYKQAIAFLEFVAREKKTLKGSEHVHVQLILSNQDGYILRPDFLAARLAGCAHVHYIHGFTNPQQKVRSAEDLDASDFPSLLEHSVGGILANGKDDCILQTLQAELGRRLSLQWTLSLPMARRNLALVGSRHDFVLEPWLRAARNLGINLTVFGSDDSWLRMPESVGIVNAYVSVDMTADSNLPSRLVTAIRAFGEQFDGVTTFTDRFLFPVARAAHILGLPTSPPVSFAKAIDKHATRIEVGSDECQVLRVKGPDDLRHQIRTFSEPLRYPLIVKPCRGWNSEGVTKVADERELFAAVSELEKGATDVLIETYVDGPEIDANYILYDGEDLFCEINDGFPCTADGGLSGFSANFMETDMLYPTNLNADERSVVRKSLHRKLLAMGFRTGVFHVEGRVRNSASEYSSRQGILDLRAKTIPPKTNPSIFLLEINARPPGMGALMATNLIYGVDFAAIHMLCALGESESIRALSQPYVSDDSTPGGGAQFWADLLSIPAQSDGVYDGDDVCEDLRKRRPDLQANVMWAMCCLKKGDYVPGPPVMVKVAYFLVFSRKSRQDVLRVAQEIRKAVQVPIDVGGVSTQGPFAAVGAKVLAQRSRGLEAASSPT